MKRWESWALQAAAAVAVMAMAALWHKVYAADPALQYRATLVREAQAVYGLEAPIPMFAGQIRQESNWSASVTAWDNGRGLAQFMDATSQQVVRQFPELGAPDPYNPAWAIRALVRYDGWILNQVKGSDLCQQWAAALKGYNAGPGFVLRAQRRSATPAVWFDHTENINAGQSAKNFTYSRSYPRWILFKHQALYETWGTPTCKGFKP